jgi:hypothetical protein
MTISVNRDDSKSDLREGRYPAQMGELVTEDFPVIESVS